MTNCPACSSPFGFDLEELLEDNPEAVEVVCRSCGATVNITKLVPEKPEPKPKRGR